MASSQRIVKNSLILTVGHVIAKLINLVLILLLTHLLGSEKFGLFSFTLAYAIMFMVLTQVGISTFLVHDLAKDKSRTAEMLGATAPLIALFTVLTVGLVNLIPWLAGWSGQERLLIAIFSIYMAFDGWSRFLIAIFRAHERMEFEAVIYVFERIGFLGIAVLLWFNDGGLLPLAVGFSGVVFLKALLAQYFTHRYFTRFRWDWHAGRAGAILRHSYPFALTLVFAAITMRIDTIMLKLFHTAEVVGLYNAARRLIESLTFVPETVVSALFPALSLLFVSRRPKFEATFQRALQYMTIIAVPLTLLLALLAPQIINLLFEPEFARAYVALRWLALWLGILFLKHLLAVSLSAIGKQHLFSVYAGIAMIINVTLNYVLIPRYDLLGASVATVVSEAATTILAVVGLRKAARLPRFSASLGKVLLVGALTAIGVYFLRQWHLWAAALLGSGGFFLLLLASGSISRSDWAFFADMVRRQFSNPQEPFSGD